MASTLHDDIVAIDPPLMFRGAVIGFTDPVKAARDLVQALDDNFFNNLGTNVPDIEPGTTIIATRGKLLRKDVFPEGEHLDIYPIGLAPTDYLTNIFNTFPYQKIAAPASSYTVLPGFQTTSVHWSWNNNPSGFLFGNIFGYTDVVNYERKHPLIPRAIEKIVIQKMDWVDDDHAPFTTTVTATGDRAWLSDPDYKSMCQLTLEADIFNQYGIGTYPADWLPTQTILNIVALYKAP